MADIEDDEAWWAVHMGGISTPGASFDKWMIELDKEGGNEVDTADTPVDIILSSESNE